MSIGAGPLDVTLTPEPKIIDNVGRPTQVVLTLWNYTTREWSVAIGQVRTFLNQVLVQK